MTSLAEKTRQTRKRLGQAQVFTDIGLKFVLQLNGRGLVGAATGVGVHPVWQAQKGEGEGEQKGEGIGGEERGNACHKNPGFCIMLTDLLVIRSCLPSINCHAFANQNVELAPCGLQERKNGNKPNSTFTGRMKTISRFLKTSKFVDQRKNTFAENKQRFRGKNEERDLSAYLASQKKCQPSRT